MSYNSLHISNNPGSRLCRDNTNITLWTRKYVLKQHYCLTHPVSHRMAKVAQNHRLVGKLVYVPDISRGLLSLG